MFKQLIPSFQERSKQFIISSVSEEGKKGKNNTKKSLNFLSYGTWFKLMKNVESCGGDLHTTHGSKSLGLKKRTKTNTN